MALKDYASMLYMGVGIQQFPLLSGNHSHVPGELASAASAALIWSCFPERGQRLWVQPDWEELPREPNPDQAYDD